MEKQAKAASVSTLSVKPDKIDELVQLMQELLPTTVPGLLGVQILVNREKSELMTIGYYETMDAAIAPDGAKMQAANRKIFDRVAQMVTGQVERTLYELSATLEQAESTQ
jgi:hypothetical protein